MSQKPLKSEDQGFLIVGQVDVAAGVCLIITKKIDTHLAWHINET